MLDDACAVAVPSGTLARRFRSTRPVLAAATIVGVLLGGLLIGLEPVGSDPDQMYRPVKQELARSLAAGEIPYWSDRLGVGVPLVAESHIAAFYPFNRVYYRYLDVDTAYRLAMWLHYVALAFATYAYARTLKVVPAGAAVAAVAFTLCGFQATHAIHEPFYHVLPYLVLALILAERFMASGRLYWLVALAFAYGVQLTLGHFQLQAFTAGLVLVTGIWRAAAERKPWRRAGGLAGGLVWGATIAAVQLVPSWELMHVARLLKPLSDQVSLYYAYPPGHWAEIAIPWLFRGMRDGPEDRYWVEHASSALEACLYIGTIPLILVFLGWVARNRPLALWKFLVPASFALATMPQWWPAGYLALLKTPIVGSFRAPARYTVVTSLGLCLIAGEGLVQGMSKARFWIGLMSAAVFGLVAAGWAFDWADQLTFRQRALPGSLFSALAWATLSWGISVAFLILWRLGRVPTVTVLLVTAGELGVLYYTGSTHWGRALRLKEKSPVFHALTRDNAVRVAGFVNNLPVRAGIVPAFPYLGFRNLPPYPALTALESWELAAFDTTLSRMRRYGVTHGAWDGPYDRYMRRDGRWLDSGALGLMFFTKEQTLYAGEDRVLDRAIPNAVNSPITQTWRAVRYKKAFPPARIALYPRLAEDTADLERGMDHSDASDDVWYLKGDLPEPHPSPRAQSASVNHWDGFRGDVSHDGGCYLVFTRAYYPGWLARVDGVAQPVFKVEGGLQAVRLTGAGVSIVEMEYQPTGRTAAWLVTVLGITGAVLILAFDAVCAFFPRVRQSVS